MPQSSQKIAHRQEVRSSILRAARDLALQEGWEALSVRKIAEAIDYSVPVIYDHFVNKEALLLEFVKQGFSILTTKLRDSQDLDNAEQRLYTAADAYISFAEEYREYYRLMFGLGVPACDAIKDLPEYKEFQQALHFLVENLPIKAQLQADLEKKKYGFWAGLHGIVCLQIFEAKKDEEFYKSVLHGFLSAFLTEAFSKNEADRNRINKSI